MRPKIEKTALQRAVDYLAKRSYSERALERKLLAAKYEREEIDAALVKLRARGYLSDDALCRDMAERMLKETNDSLAAIRCKLLRQGFLETAVDAATADAFDEREFAAAQATIAVKFRRMEKAEPLTAAKYLCSRGFSQEIALRAAKCELDTYFTE